ncbi:MAG: MEDS domain-containing protein [Deltaproteobacteria bacterium]|nr:MEDS domain-containing protein [Deltaproteobacteria bacterium]
MDYLTIQEVADILKVHPNTAYKMCRQGTLPAVKIGKEWRIDRDKLGSFMELGVVPAAGTAPAVADSALAGLPDLGHVLGIFADQESIWDFESDFFRAARAGGHRLLKACWWQDPAQVRASLTAAGLPVERLEAAGELVIVELSSLFQRLGPVGAAGAWFQEVVGSLERGYRRLYGSGSPDFACCGAHAALLEFESTLDQMLKDLPILGVCSYHWPGPGAQDFSEVMDLIELHDQFFLAAGGRRLLAQKAAS